MNKSRLATDFFKIVVLVVTAVVTVATSKNEPGSQRSLPPIKSYLTASDCPNTTPQESISVSNGRIIYPDTIHFSAFGLPSQYLWIGEDQVTAGNVNATERSCRYSLYSNTPKIHIYRCYEFGLQVCTVSFEETAN